MNKIVSIKNNTIFLATILVTGIIALSSPSFIVGIVQAENEYYEIDSSYKSKDSSDSFKKYKDSAIVKKIECINTNTNINEVKSDDIKTFSVPLNANGLVDVVTEQDINNDGRVGTSTFGYNERNDNGGADGRDGDRNGGTLTEDCEDILKIVSATINDAAAQPQSSSGDFRQQGSINIGDQDARTGNQTGLVNIGNIQINVAVIAQIQCSILGTCQ